MLLDDERMKNSPVKIFNGVVFSRVNKVLTEKKQQQQLAKHYGMYEVAKSRGDANWEYD